MSQEIKGAYLTFEPTQSRTLNHRYIQEELPKGVTLELNSALFDIKEDCDFLIIPDGDLESLKATSEYFAKFELTTPTIIYLGSEKERGRVQAYAETKNIDLRYIANKEISGQELEDALDATMAIDPVVFAIGAVIEDLVKSKNT